MSNSIFLSLVCGKNYRPFKLKSIFKIVNYIFHPLLVAVWLVFLLALLDPGMTFFFNGVKGVRLLVILSLLMVVIPLIFMKILKEFGLISGFEMSNKKDRVQAFSIVVVPFITNYYMLYHLGAPRALQLLILGITVMLLLLAAVSIFYKISAHMAGIGGGIGMMAYLVHYIGSAHFFFILAIVLAGVIASARLSVGAHSNIELITGLLLGTTTLYVVFLVNWLPMV